MEPDPRDASITSTRKLIETVSRATSRFQIVSLDRQVHVCKDHDPFDDIAIPGQLKAGKSSFGNRLIGKPVLPVGAIPVTTTRTRIQSDPKGTACVSIP